MIKEKFTKIFIRESIIKESSQYGIYLSNDEFMEYFVSPFTDVLKAAKLTLKDVGTGVLYNMRILFTFSTTKKQRLLNAYQQKQEQFAKEHSDFVKKVSDGMGTDAKIVAFMANPTAYLGVQALKKGVGAAKFVNDVFKEQRLAVKDQEEGGIGPGGKVTGDARGPIRGALADLKNLFFGESLGRDHLDVLLEVGGESIDIGKEIESEIKRQGLDFDLSKIEKGFQEFVSIKENAIKEIVDEGIPERMKALSDLMSAKEYNQLEAAVASAKSAGVDLGNYLADFKSEMSRGNEEIKEKFADEDSGEAAKESKLMQQMKKLPGIKKLGEKVTAKDYEREMEDYLFNTLKSNLQEDGGKIFRETQKDMAEVSSILLAPYESIEEMTKELSDSSSEAERIVSKISDIIKVIQFR
jgi:hypothetical protein